MERDGCVGSDFIAVRASRTASCVRCLFVNEPGVLIICFPRKGKRVYRTVCIPKSVFQRVVTRLSRVA
jgi:hypothetical protein